MQCQQIEELHLEVFKNTKLENLIRFEFGANIFAIDNYYNPKCEIEVVFEKLLEIQPNYMENAQILLKIATRFLKHVELKPKLKNMAFLKNLDDFENFQFYLPLFMKACEIFYSQDSPDLLKTYLSVQYAKYFNLKMIQN
jgi:hypothetical protein